MTTPSSATAISMNTSPPNDVAIWAAFSVSNCGKSVPMPRARPPTASVNATTVPTLTSIMKSLACNR